MLLSLQSTGPQYNHLQTNFQVPWNCDYVKYYVSSVNFRSILITTTDDVIEYEYTGHDGRTVKVSRQLNDNYTITVANILNYLEHEDATLGDVILVEFTRTDRLRFEPKVPGFKFTKMSHRAALVTGLYNIELNKEYPANVWVTAEIPIRDYANKLYLVSKQGQSIKSNIGKVEYMPSVIANIDCVVKGGVPVLVNFEHIGKPIKNVVNIDSFKQIELELVDFQYQPVPLISPMFVTIKVKPCPNPKMILT